MSLAITLKPFHRVPQNSRVVQRPRYIKSSIETNIGRRNQQPNSVKRYWRLQRKRLVTKKSPAISLKRLGCNRKGYLSFNFCASFFQRFSELLRHLCSRLLSERLEQIQPVFSFFQTRAGSATYCFDNSNFVSACSFRITSNSVFSSAASAGPAATATAAAAETPNFSSIAETSSTTSITDIAATASDLVFSDRHNNCS